MAIVKSDQFDFNDVTGQFLVRANVDEKTKAVSNVGRNGASFLYQCGAIVRGEHVDHVQAMKDKDGPTIVIVDCGDYAQIHDSTINAKK